MSRCSVDLSIKEDILSIWEYCQCPLQSSSTSQPPRVESTLESSTITFRNSDGEPELALCTNFDVTDILNFNSAIQA
ncbi:MAG: PAS domain-containing protein [Gammaproteobacteria bacterium]|nr:PAS domain-containing protein [Gammaproteobacteria bacterium]